jgi:hypothetical protein
VGEGAVRVRGEPGVLREHRFGRGGRSGRACGLLAFPQDNFGASLLAGEPRALQRESARLPALRDASLPRLQRAASPQRRMAGVGLR